MQNGILIQEQSSVCVSFISICLLFLFFAMFPVTQTRHYALDPDRAKETPNMLHLHKATGQVLYAAFPTQKTKLIFDSDWCSDFLSPAPPWRTKEFSCYLWTFATTLNSTPQHQSEHGTPQEIQVDILKVTKEKFSINAKSNLTKKNLEKKSPWWDGPLR